MRTAVGLLLLSTLIAIGCTGDDPRVEGELRQWHPMSLTFTGPQTGEAGEPNPFRDFRLRVTFTHLQSGTTYAVPGFYAADGNAAESSATQGNRWRVRFTPDRAGEWRYAVSFRTGEDVALRADSAAGEALHFDGASGTFEIAPTDDPPDQFRGRGFLRYAGERYLRFQNGDYFLKGGADSPENLLAYADFDGTVDGDGLAPEGEEARQGEATAAPDDADTFLHRYEPHVRDWRSGDPTWQGENGKGLIGAINYLSDQEMNSVYFLTMNVAGDGNDVWPWTDHGQRYRYDVSKLAQWNVVFEHMQDRGIMMHVLTQETENDTLLDDGELGPQRRLYYRELVARFGHHLALKWNLGEENTNSDAQRRAYAEYIRRLDPYDHPIVVHTYPGQYDQVFAPLLGYEHFEGPSIQLAEMEGGHELTREWLQRSREAGRPWFVTIDEPGNASAGVTPDGPNDNHARARSEALWANLMAGGAGVEWYFGYDYPHNDLNCEDWRSRADVWAYTRHALHFFHEHLPFPRMEEAGSRTSTEDDYVLALTDSVYAVYRPNGGNPELTIGEGSYRVRWFDPRGGGSLQTGSVATVDGPGTHSLGSPPSASDEDWVVLARRID